MKKLYESPELKVVSFNLTDVIMTSTESTIPEIIVGPGDEDPTTIDLDF